MGRDVGRATVLGPGWRPLQRALGIDGDVQVVAGASATTIGATVGRTIFLGDRVTEPAVVAHELVHVAARSTRPRFFHGPLDDEERRARAVESVVAQATVRPSGTVTRVESAPAPALAPATPTPTPTPTPPAPPPAIQRAAAATTGPATGPTTAPTNAPAQDTATTTARLNWFDDLVVALEDRVLAELERRGGRYRGEF